MIFSLQILRAYAAIIVVLLHLSHLILKYLNVDLTDIFQFGFSGVQLFFILSGFIITYIHKKDINKGFDRFVFYLKKRFIRIYPIYWVIFFSVFIMAVVFKMPSHIDNISIFLNNVFLLPQKDNLLLVVVWTLQYEIFFYLIFALFILNQRLHKFFYGSFIFLLYVVLYDSALFQNHASFNIFLFLMGGIIALYYEKLNIDYSKSKFVLMSGILSYIIVSIFICINDKIPLQEIILGVVGSLIIIGLIYLEKNGYNFKKFRSLILVGNASYVIYLIHYPIISVLMKLYVKSGVLKHITFFEASIFFIIISLFVVIFVGILVHKFIEIPLMKYLNRKLL